MANNEKFSPNSYGNAEILRISPGVRTHLLNKDKKNVFTLNHQSAVSDELQECDVHTVQAIFKLHIHKITVEKSCCTFLKEHEKLNHTKLQLKWDFMGFEDTTMSREHVKNGDILFDYSMKYHIDMDEKSVDDLKKASIHFEIFAITSNDSIFLGTCDHKIHNIFEKLNTKRHSNLDFFNNLIQVKGSIISCSISYRLRCNKKHLSDLMMRIKRGNTSSPAVDIEDSESPTSSEMANVFEIQRLKDGLKLVLNRNKAIKTTQSEISNELHDRVEWLKKEADWKRTLQESKVLKGEDMDEVQWRQWRDSTTAIVNSRHYTKADKEDHDPVLTITIVEVTFRKKSKPLKNENITKVFVEYTFLGLEGPEMETPYSVIKPKGATPLPFNFSKKFPIHIENNYENCKRLSTMVKNQESIDFVVVSEPEEDPNRPVQTCVEIGCAKLNVAEMVNLLKNEERFDCEIADWQNESEIVGNMVVHVEGILAMRKMALLILSPEKYKHYF